MPASRNKLSVKITSMLVLFFLVALTAISLTLLVSRQLEGGAAAINDAGSQRMRSYRLGYLLFRGQQEPEAYSVVAAEIGIEMERFDKVLFDLERGDPARPLSPPRDAEIFRSVQEVKEVWQRTIKPLLADYLKATDGPGRSAVLARYDGEVVGFVAVINELVLRMEQSYAFNTTLLRSFQVALAVLAVIGTAILIHFFFVLVIRPVDKLHAGMRRMAGNDLGVRLPVETNDEFGILAGGFNQMAAHLQDVYGTLEQRVESKTRSLAEKNRQLEMLYAMTAFLNAPGSLEELCQGFIRHLTKELDARAGAVRLYSFGTEELFLVAHEGLSEAFVKNEMSLRCGECLCGEVMQQGAPVSFDVAKPPSGMQLRSCVREGFRTASAFTISHTKQTLGVFNIYFDAYREFSAQEVHLLETLGQHLGVAVENQRLRAREKELAVSEERNLLAQELHDSIAQGLAFLNLQVQLLQDSLKQGNIDESLLTARQIREGVQESYEDVRELLVHFRTRMHHSDLDSAILAALERFENQVGVATQFDRVGKGPPLAADDEVQVLHIVQEALSNIRKHARAKLVEVRVERGPGGLVITVADNGDGFDPATEPALSSDRHVGMKIMAERARRVGGACTVTSAVGKGTQVTFSLPRQQ